MTIEGEKNMAYDVMNDLINNKAKIGNGIKNIMFTDIVMSEDNPFELENIEELKAKILAEGFNSVLVVSSNTNKKYEIISGHCRFKALCELIAEGNEQFEEIPCKIINVKDNVEKIMLMLSYNTSGRDYNSEDNRKRIVEECKKAWLLLKESNRKPKGRFVEWVAPFLGVSPRKAQEYISVVNNYDDDLIKTKEVTKKIDEEEAAQKKITSTIKKLRNNLNYLANVDLNEILESANFDERSEVNSILNELKNVIDVISSRKF